MHNIAVLMCTYNGEKYLQEQVDSILAQEGVNVRLYIRDDCSTDGTRQMLKRLEGYDNICVHYDTHNLGPGMGFMKMAFDLNASGDVEAHHIDYVCFADQDDIWLPEKLARGVEMIGDTDEPVLYCSNQLLYFNGERQGTKRLSGQPDMSLEGHITKNVISGCTMIFNVRLLREISRCREVGHDVLDFRMHDAWVFLVALLVGKVIYDDESYILYRIHENNTVGVAGKSYFERLMESRRPNRYGVKCRNLRYKTARLLLGAYKPRRAEDEALLRLIAGYKDSFANRLKLALSTGIQEKSGEKRLIYMARVLLGQL